MLKKFAALFVFVFASAATAQAQTEDFKGEFKVEQKQLSAVKKIALVDLSGQTKLDGKKDGAWTEDAVKELTEQARRAGYDAVMGPEVKAAFSQIAPLPTEDEIRAVLKKKTRMSDSDAGRSAKGISEMWAKQEPGDAAKFGFTLYRPEGSVNLERPMYSPDDPSKTKAPDKKEIQRRIAALREKLGVDAVVFAEFGFGSWKYEEPEYIKQGVAAGKTRGILATIDTVRGVKKGTTADVFINLEFYDREGKNKIVLVKGSCKSKEGTGFSFKVNSKLEAMMPETAQGCIQKVFEKLASKQ